MLTRVEFQDEISRVLLRILQAHGKATEFLATIVLEEVKNLGKYYCCDMFWFNTTDTYILLMMVFRLRAGKINLYLYMCRAEV